MKLRILEILKEKGKTKYWLYNQLGLSYQNFNKIYKKDKVDMEVKEIESYIVKRKKQIKQIEKLMS